MYALQLTNQNEAVFYTRFSLDNLVVASW